MRVEAYKRLENGIILKTTRGQVKIEIYDNNIFRIAYTLNDEFSKKDSLMVLPQKAKNTKWDINETNKVIVLSTEIIKLSIDKETGAFKYLDSHGNIIVKEPDRGGKTLETTDVMISVFEENAEIKAGQSVDGIRARVENFKKVEDRKAYHTKLEFVWEENEALYGLGSHEDGIMNLRGHHQYLYQQNMKAVVPVLVSTKGYGILMDSYSLMTFHDDVYGSYIWTEVDDELDYYFIYGPELDQVVGSYRKLTGTVPMLPKWALGYVQSKERYVSQDELIAVVKEYRERKIPLDLIVLDWKSWSGELWGQKSFDPERFPNPKNMMEELHAMNARLMVSIWPIIRAGGENHREMLEHGYMLGNQSTYDAFNEKARELYWKQANEGLFSNDIDAWWCDCTEPFESDWSGEVKPEPEKRLMINTEESKKYIDPEYINAFSLLHSKGIYEGQRKVTDKKRVVNLTRSAYAGQHRYATITWSGDISANWGTLRNEIPDGLNFCTTGEPYWTTDIGGFFVGNEKSWRKWCGNEEAPRVWFWNGDYDDGCEDLGYRELYLRWFQYGTFLPMFRSHGTDTPREVWRFGESGTVFYDTLVKFIHLRYRLLPYIYSLAGMVTHLGYTMMRALAFDFRQDPDVFNIADQYMFGPAFLVNPVTKPMHYESNSRELENIEKSRSVYLPAGSKWYDFWTGEVYEGGQKIITKADLEILPLFVRSGAIIPMGPIVQHTGEKPETPIELRIYPGADGEFTIYEDEGDNYNYEKGSYAFTKVKWNDVERTLTFEERCGIFDGMNETKTYKIVLVSINHGLGIEETSQFDQVVAYTGKCTIIELKNNYI